MTNIHTAVELSEIISDLNGVDERLLFLYRGRDEHLKKRAIQELANSRTKVQEAQMWLERAIANYNR